MQSLFFNLAFASGQEDDLGTAGKTWAVTEKSFLAVIEEQAKEAVASGRWQKLLDERQAQMEEYVNRPTGKALPLATKSSRRLHNPTLVLPEDILDHENRVLFKAGTRINPLDVMPLTRIMMFFDADNAKQLTWATEYISSYTGNKRLVPILVMGSVEEAMKALDRQVFFDQGQFLINEYAIEQLPSLVYQARNDDRYLTIEEVGL